MMKFPKPRNLTENSYPDLTEDQPTLLNKLVQAIKPKENLAYDRYIDSSIAFVKSKSKENSKNAKLYQAIVGKKLFFVMAIFPNAKEAIPCLVDTGASNSLLHQSVVSKLDLPMKPTSMRIATATGTSSSIITGTSHLTFQLLNQQKHPTKFCTNFIITKKLNGMQCILGAEFLLDESKVLSISASGLLVINDDKRFHIPITTDKESVKLNNSILSDITEENEYENISDISHEDQISQNINIAEPELVYVHLTHTAEANSGNSTKYQRTNEETSVAVLYNHNISEDLEDETLPPSEQFFDENMELKFKSLQKTLSLDDADYSQCPSMGALLG